MLVGTIRNEIATCSEKAYASLPVSNAKNLLFLDSDGAVIQFAKEVSWRFMVLYFGITFPLELLELPGPSLLLPLNYVINLLRCTDSWSPMQKGWEVRDGRVYFPVEESEKEALPSGTIIENTIGYAHELETIV